MENSAPDILIFFSDQHGYKYNGFAGNTDIQTPNLDRIAANGVVFDQCYTTCPLCVPARTSFMTGRMPMNTGVYTNDQSIASDSITFAHSLAASGYETVLCGRMHFVGEDQRHGFTKRIADDMGSGAQLGPYVGTRGALCTTVAGGGRSPVLEYDEYVVQKAVDYFAEQEQSTVPQCVVVGVYQPHNSYVAPPDLYRHYMDCLGEPDSRHCADPSLEPLRRENLVLSYPPAGSEQLEKIRASYYGMVTNMDRQLGDVSKAWRDYLQRAGRRGIFIYVSDHGDMLGEKGLYAKQVFFEASAKIPLIVEGFGIGRGVRCTMSCSIADIGPTLCELTGSASLPHADGKSLCNVIREGCSYETGEHEESESIMSELLMFPGGDTSTMVSTGEKVPAVMLKKGRYKYIQYYGRKEFLYDVEADPDEGSNILDEQPQVAAAFREELKSRWRPEQIVEEADAVHEELKIIQAWRQSAGYVEKETHPVPEESRQLPEI